MQINLNAASPTSSSTDIASAPAGDLGSEFMTLLMAELKSQDPISPVDPTQMVGQMVSLNELDQLIQIRQVLQTNSASSQTSTVPVSGAH